MHIVHIISSLKRGGAEQLLANLLEAWPQDTHTVIYFHDGPVRTEIELNRIRCIQIHGWGGFVNPLFLLKLLFVLRQIRPERAITHLWAANLLGRICGRLLSIPTVCVLHTVAAHEGNVRAWIDRSIGCKATKTVAVSDIVQRSFAKSRVHKDIMIIPNGIDPKKISERAQQELTEAQQLLAHICPKSFIIGCVGRFIPEKNFIKLIEAFAQLLQEEQKQSLHLLLVGTGVQEQELRMLATQLQIREFVTFIINKPAYSYYRYFSCFVQPSQFEGLSIALLEAIASRKPVIVTGHNHQHPVIVHEEHGLVIDPNDRVVSALVTALKKIIDQPEQAATYAEKNFAQLEQKFHIDQTVSAYKNLLTTIK